VCTTLAGLRAACVAAQGSHPHSTCIAEGRKAVNDWRPVVDHERLARMLSDACDAVEARGEASVSVPLVLARALVRVITPPRPAMTRQQRKVYSVLRECIQVRGYVPTLGEIAVRVDLQSAGTVSEHISNLKRKGYVTVAENRHRWQQKSITLVPPVLP
jgi:hypothetical protein